MILRIGLIALVFLSTSAGAEIQSDCASAELKSIKNAELQKQFVLNGSVSAFDCTPVMMGSSEYLLLNIVASTESGLESYLALFDRKGFSERAAPVFKSPALAYDSFPMLVKNVQRLVFVHPSSDKNRLVLFLSLQTGPAATRLSRWELLLDKKTLTETTRSWTFEAGILAKIYQDKETWRALIDIRSVEL